MSVAVRRFPGEAVGEWVVVGLLVLPLLLLAVGEPGPTTFRAVWVAMILAAGVKCLHGRWIRGRVLVDCGPHPRRRLFVVGMVLLVLLTLIKLLPSSRAWSAPTELECGSSFLCIACLGMMLGFRLQFTDRGIWRYYGLIRWEDIDAYQWTKEGNVEFSRKGFLTLTVPIPVEKRNAVERWLSEWCPTRQIN